MAELFKIQSRLETQLTDQGRSRRNNIRIYSIPEDRTGTPLAPAPPDGAPPRSIVVRFLSYRTKEEKRGRRKGLTGKTPFPAKLRVFYPDGTRVYTTAEEATKEMSEKGLPVTVIKPLATLMHLASAFEEEEPAFCSS
ncbi:unnamed protein product [Leuciscus chuanchicus]